MPYSALTTPKITFSLPEDNRQMEFVPKTSNHGDSISRNSNNKSEVSTQGLDYSGVPMSMLNMAQMRVE